MAGCRKAVLSGQVEEAHGVGTPGPLFCREMILIIHGFPSDIIALQFEWAWQNPGKSRRLRHVASKKTKEIALKFCFRVLAEMLNVGPWNRLPLTIRWLKQEYKMEFDADRQPPKHMPIAYGPLNKRKAKKGSKGDIEEAKDVTDYKCVECFKKIKDPDDCISCLLANCPMKAHLICLAKRFLMENGDTSCLIPIDGDCPTCYHTFLWRDWLKYRHQTDQEASETNSDNPHWAEALHQ